MGVVGYSVAEIRRLLQLLTQEDTPRLALQLHWSRWRRQHQWQAQQAHTRRRTRQLATATVPEASLDLPDPLCIAGLPPLTPARWDQIARLLPPERTAGRPYRAHRQILDGMLWLMTAGTSWRQLPASFGPWETIYYRFQRWKREGLWAQIRTILLATEQLSL
jgi:Putative transposase of IS4/5 family (DUF4096)